MQQHSRYQKHLTTASAQLSFMIDNRYQGIRSAIWAQDSQKIMAVFIGGLDPEFAAQS